MSGIRLRRERGRKRGTESEYKEVGKGAAKGQSENESKERSLRGAHARTVRTCFRDISFDESAPLVFTCDLYQPLLK